MGRGEAHPAAHRTDPDPQHGQQADRAEDQDQGIQFRESEPGEAAGEGEVRDVILAAAGAADRPVQGAGGAEPLAGLDEQHGLRRKDRDEVAGCDQDRVAERRAAGGGDSRGTLRSATR